MLIFLNTVDFFVYFLILSHKALNQARKVHLPVEVKVNSFFLDANEVLVAMNELHE